MRVEFPPLCGRDHLAFRSFYAPVKSVVDGDICEQFNSPIDIKHFYQLFSIVDSRMEYLRRINPSPIEVYTKQ